MTEQIDENIVVKEILNQFFNDASKDKNIPNSLVAAMEKLRHEKKIAKGDNLKTLLISYDEPEIKNEV